MTPSDHLEAAKAAAAVLSQGNLTQTSKSLVVGHWATHMLSYLKGA